MEKTRPSTRPFSGLAEKCLWILIIGGSLLRIFICFEQNPLDYLFSDPARHWSNGIRFFHPSYIGAGDAIAFQAYVYCLQLITGSNRYLVAGMSALLSIVMPWSYYRLAKEAGLPRDRTLIVWVLVLWNPSLILIYHYIMIETLLLPLIAFSLWSALRCERAPSHSAWLFCVGLWTLTVLTKTTILPLAAVCLFWLWWRTSKRPYWILSGSGLIVVMLIPSSVRSEKYLGFIAPLGNPWVVELIHRDDAYSIQIDVNNAVFYFSSPSANSFPLDPFSAWMIDRAHSRTLLHVVVDPRFGARDWKEASDKIRPGLRTRMDELTDNVILFLFSPSWPDSDRSSWDGWINFYARWMWAPLIFFLFDCNLRIIFLKKFPLIPVAVTVLTLFLAFQNMATMEGRYRKAVEPLLLLNLIWIFSPKRNMLS